MTLGSKVVFGLVLGVLVAGGAAGQFDITDVSHNLTLRAGVSEFGSDYDIFDETISDNSIQFQEALEADVSVGFTSIQAMLSQESSLVGGTLSASSRAGIGWTAFSGSSGGAAVMTSLVVDFRIDVPTPFEFTADATGTVPLGSFPSTIEIAGTPDGGGSQSVAYFQTTAGSASGVLQPGDYTVVAFSGSNYTDFFETTNPDPMAYSEAHVWSFELTLVPAPATLTALPMLAALGLRRRR